MSAKTLIVSTCGTSLLTNGAPNDVRSWLTQRANAEELPVEEGARLQVHAEECAARFSGADVAQARKSSAEYNGIGALRDRGGLGEVAHILIHTDTALGRATAQILERRLREQDKEQVALMTAGGLRTDDLGSFQTALSELTKELFPILESYRKQGYHRVFQLTGGFKSLNGYLQALGMLWSEECVYLFESSQALLSIPRLPVGMDREGTLEAHMEFGRRLQAGYSAATLVPLARKMPESLVLVMDGLASWSVWGQELWLELSPRLRSKKLWEPLSPKLVLGPKVSRSFDSLSHDHKRAVNEKLDALSAYLDEVRPLLKSETFKGIEGKAYLPSTHEMYAWSTSGGGRLLGHYEGKGTFVVDDIVPHL